MVVHDCPRRSIGTQLVPELISVPRWYPAGSMARARIPKLTEERLARMAPPVLGESTQWCGTLPRFGVRLRAGSATKTFILKYRTTDGRQRKMTLGNWPALSVDAARRLARQHLGDVERGQDPAAVRVADRAAPSMADLATAYLETKAHLKRPASLRDDRANWQQLILPAIGTYRVKEVTAQDVQILHRSRAATPYRGNRMLALLSNAFSLAVRWGWRSDNPAKGVQKFYEDRRERYLQPDELDRLVEVLRNHSNRRAANAVRLLLLTGARRSEALSAQWKQFDLTQGIWTKPSAHTKQRRTHRVPLSSVALALLHEMRADAGATASPYLFPGDAIDKPLADIKNFWRSVCRNASLDDLRLHDLRHQFASMLASSGQSLPIIGGLLGHTQPGTTARYAHLLDDPLRAATEQVGALIEPSKPATSS